MRYSLVTFRTDGDPARDPNLTARLLDELGATMPLPVRGSVVDGR